MSKCRCRSKARAPVTHPTGDLWGGGCGLKPCEVQVGPKSCPTLGAFVGRFLWFQLVAFRLLDPDRWGFEALVLVEGRETPTPNLRLHGAFSTVWNKRVTCLRICVSPLLVLPGINFAAGHASMVEQISGPVLDPVEAVHLNSTNWSAEPRRPRQASRM